jgi:acyl-coenzyme A synthetase/AMP-(fatty) acid ligase
MPSSVSTGGVPTRMRRVEDLPRNAMGKVVKARVKEMF